MTSVAMTARTRGTAAKRGRDAVAERDDDDRPNSAQASPCVKLSFREIDTFRMTGRREDEDRDLYADDEERELAPDHAPLDGPFPSRFLPGLRHYKRALEIILARSKYQKPTTKRTSAIPAEYASASHCGAQAVKQGALVRDDDRGHG